jgi:tyrosine-protein kinase Etk/Wzc
MSDFKTSKFKLNDDIDNESLLYILLENINFLVSIFSVSFFITLIVYLTTTAFYQSTSLIEIQKENNLFKPSGAEGLMDNTFSNSLKAEVEIYKSNDTISDVLSKLNSSNFFEDKEIPSVGQIRSGLFITENRNTLITVNLRYPDQELVPIILDSLTFEYIEDRKDFKKKKTALGREFIKNEIPRVRGLLLEAENKLNDFKLSSNSVGVIFGSDNRNLKLSDLKQKISDISFKEFELKEFYRESHPIYVTLIQQKELLKQQLLEIENEIPNIPKSQRDLENFQREVKLYSDVLKDLSTQELTLAMNEASSLSNVRIINQASESVKVSPNRAIFGVPFVILILSYLGFAINNFLRDKITHQDALIDFVGKNKVIGELPLIHKKNENKRKFLEELCNELLNKCSYELLNRYEKKTSFMVTSSRRNVGKTEVSKRLFEKLIDMDEKVCLLDLDYRKAELSKRLYKDKDTDFKSFDDFNKRKDEFIRKNGLFIPAFEIDNPINFFKSEEFISELEQLRKDYDIVICDTPPWTLFVDAKLLSNIFDNFIYVVGNKISSFRDIDLFLKDNDGIKENKISYFFNKYDLYFDFLWLKLQYPYYYSNYYYDYYSGYKKDFTKYSNLVKSLDFLKKFFRKWTKRSKE